MHYLMNLSYHETTMNSCVFINFININKDE